jgi:hypothetical protein
MNKNELQAQLDTLRSQMSVYANAAELTDAEAERLAGMNKDALKLEGKLAAIEQVEKGEKDKAERYEAEKAAAVEAAVKQERELAEAQGRRLPGPNAPYQSQYSDVRKYDNLDATELSLVIDALNASAQVTGRKAPANAVKAMALRVAEMKDDNTNEGKKEVAYVKNAFKAATGIDPNPQAVEGALKAATDPMYTGGSTIGSDWVGTAYSTELWRVIRSQNQVVSRIPADVIPDGFSSKIWPLEGADPSWYKIAEATASDGTLKVPAATIAASQAATGSKTLSVGKLGARVLFTGELTEDSLIPFAPQLRAQLEASGQEILESLAIDGDVETSASKNVNAIDTTPSATDYFLICDGFRKLPLITTTANALSAGGSLNVDDFLSILQLMGTAGLAGGDPSKVNFIVDGNVHYALAKLPEVKTRDVNSAATVENGFVSRIYGVGVIPSWQMHRASAKRMANTAGKIDADTDANNTRGAVVAVRWDQWKQAYKRRMTMETTRIANADSWEIVAIARWGLGYRDGEASAILYNVGV